MSLSQTALSCEIGIQRWRPNLVPKGRIGISNRNSAVDLLMLQTAELLLVYNNSMNERNTPLTVALSPDADRTCRFAATLPKDHLTYAYPFAIQTRDGNIH